MSLGERKLVVLVVVVAIVVLPNRWLVASWLEKHGVIDAAQHICSTYLTRAAITIIIVLVGLLVRPTTDRFSHLWTCPVTYRAAAGKVCITPTRVAIEATEDYRQARNMGRGGGITNGWEFWSPKT